MKRITDAFIIEFATQMTDREFAIIETIEMLGLVTGSQIERLHFSELSHGSRSRVRRRVLRRLADGRAVTAFPRRVGGARRGSDGHVYALGPVGVRLMRQRQGLSGALRPQRRSLPGAQLLRHVLDVSELYARLVEASRTEGFTLAAFAAEPASWWRDQTGTLIKPDAYAELAAHGHTDHWWLEIDRATESVPTVLRQLAVYSAFAARGEAGPSGVIPRVLVTVPTAARCAALTDALSRLKDAPQGFSSPSRPMRRLRACCARTSTRSRTRLPHPHPPRKETAKNAPSAQPPPLGDSGIAGTRRRTEPQPRHPGTAGCRDRIPPARRIR